MVALAMIYMLSYDINIERVLGRGEVLRVYFLEFSGGGGGG